MTTLIAIFLGVLILESTISLYNNFSIVKNNYRVHFDIQKNYKNRIKYLEKRLEYFNEDSKKMLNDKAASYIITHEGIKLLPDRWANYIAEGTKNERKQNESNN